MHSLFAICALAASAAANSPAGQSLPFDAWPVVTNAASARTTIFAVPTRKVRFLFEGTVVFPHRPGFPYLTVKDDTGYLMMLLDAQPAALACAPGDRLRVAGRATENEPDVSDAFCESAAVVRRADAPADFVRPASGEDIAAGRADCAPVRLSGILTAHFTDDSNPRFRCLIVEADNRAVYCTMPDTGEADAKDLAALVGHCVTVTGLCHPSPPSPRLHAGRVVFIQSRGDIAPAPALADRIFAAPDIAGLRTRKMSEIDGLGRHRTVGRVLTAFRNGNVILSGDAGAVLHVRLVGAALPAIGATVEVLGIPAPDLYHIKLVRAVYRPCAPAAAAPAPPPPPIDSRELCGKRLRPDHLGRTVRVAGKVVNLQSPPESDRCLFVDDGRQLVKVVVRDGRLPDATAPGSTIETTGICVLETDDDRSRDGYTSLRGFFVVPPGPEAFRIVRRPSWWTPLRLLLSLAVLLAVAVAVCIWNLLLKISVRRKSRELEQEIAMRISSDIKVFERTRLAVELHDALSQTLTGVAMEIRAAAKAVNSASDRCRLHLSRAERTVDACRGELRDCIWDLRNDAMDDPDMNEAVRRTLAPHLGGATLSVRFTVSRDRFSDHTTHAILRIVRELTVNAVRHGQATVLRVAGTIENGKFVCSVRDNGCGFDPATAPGISSGHFGLQGIRERVERFEGELIIDSAQGRGTKVTVMLTLPQGEPA